MSIPHFMPGSKVVDDRTRASVGDQRKNSSAEETRLDSWHTDAGSRCPVVKDSSKSSTPPWSQSIQRMLVIGRV